MDCFFIYKQIFISLINWEKIIFLTTFFYVLNHKAVN